MISNEMDPLVVNSGAAALDVIARQSGTLDMILMDITLGDMEGFDVIQTIRRNGVTTPVIIISGRNEDYDFMYGLSLGADDYVTKPFRPQILGAKVKALIRRSKSFSQENSQQISCGPFLCDTTTMRFYKNNVELNLSEKERSLLLLFVRHPQQVFTKDMIYEQIWGNLIAVDDNAIMVYINRLRSKIEDNARTPPAHHHHPGRGLPVRAVRTSFFQKTKKKSSQLRAVQLAALWFYAGIKHKTLKKENRMKFVCVSRRKNGGEKSEGISVNPFRSVVGKPQTRFYAISLNLRGKRKA
ncbi:MAG: response regulator transcription factor [Faecalibacterium sp.]